MLLKSLWDIFEKMLFDLPSGRSTELLFNPYAHIDLDLDLPNAAALRRENLRSYLSSFISMPAILILGEAPGWRGCRFSGVPFTSEAQLLAEALPFPGVRSSRRAVPYTEATATIFWRVMQSYHPHFLAWNCFPLHPYQAGNHLSNRQPTRTEIASFEHLLREIVAHLAPQRVVAVGKVAESALLRAGIPCTHVRHPAYGGADIFQQEMITILSNL